MKKILCFLLLLTSSVLLFGCKKDKLEKIKVVEVARSIFYAWIS